ncbi:MAG: M20 family metallopeptidase [Acidobacteriota bacterium]|nr:M20 family metallopeptidase [Acidobacteriota bacterium]
MNSLDFYSNHLDGYLEELMQFTAVETPTGNIKQLDRAADFLMERVSGLGFVEREVLPDHGPLLRIVREGTGVRVLLLGHFDTVWPIGCWPKLWRVDNGRVYGPGVYDMKGGLLFIVWLLRFLEQHGLSHPHIEAVFNPDEEIGSPGSRPLIEEAARRADVVLVLEPTNLEGNLKLARKGSGEYVITINGRSAHQGVEPELGVNAVVEAAHQVLKVLELEDLTKGTTVGPNVIQGGRVSNMVPDQAEIRVDVRAWTSDETRRLEKAIRGLSPIIDGSKIQIFGGFNRPPMEVSDASMEIFEGARVLGRGLGLDLAWVKWGGSSDANIAAAVGTPTIDGFGPVGEGAHQLEECIVVDEVPRRLALLTEVVRSFVHID